MGEVPIRLTTLVENCASRPGISAEWGLCIYVEADGEDILFDTGASSAVSKTIDVLGIKWNPGTKIVLSHAHADHTGGLRDVLRKIGETEVNAHPSIWELKYTQRPYEDEATYIGIPFVKDELKRLGAKFNLSDSPYQISENIWTTGEIPMKTDYEEIDPVFYIKEEDGFRSDPLADDLALILRSKMGLVIILGCAHRGLVNTIYHAQNITGEKKVHTVIGGTHLFPKTDRQKEKTIQALKKIGVHKIGVSHCTGFDASMKLAKAFGDTFFFNNAGTIYTID